MGSKTLKYRTVRSLFVYIVFQASSARETDQKKGVLPVLYFKVFDGIVIQCYVYEKLKKTFGQIAVLHVRFYERERLGQCTAVSGYNLQIRKV